MQIVLHAGAHYTESDRMVQTMLRNAAPFAERGVRMPDPMGYRGLVRDTLNAMHRAAPGPDARAVLLDAILGDVTGEPRRLILADPNLFRTPGTAVQEGILYPAAAQRLSYLAQIFARDDLHLFLAIRNPAALLPILHSVAVRPDDASFWGGRDPRDLRWSQTLAAIRAAVPEMPGTVWCNEDMPFLWSQIIRDMAGLGDQDRIAGGFDLLTQIMSKEGMQRFRAYLGSHPDMSEMQKRRVIAAFLDKFALDEEIEEELDMAGWTDETVAELTAIYDADMAAIAAIPGVTLVTP